MIKVVYAALLVLHGGVHLLHVVLWDGTRAHLADQGAVGVLINVVLLAALTVFG